MVGAAPDPLVARPRSVVACDVGSLRSDPCAFAWARIQPGQPGAQTSTSIEELVDVLRRDAASKIDVALGFEAPLFVPVPNDPRAIGRARLGEGNRPYSVGAGLAVTVMGLQQSAWVLRAVAPAFAGYETTTDWRRWPARAGAPILLLWEAFVTGPAKSPTHEGDATTAAAAFVQGEGGLDSVNAVTAEAPLNLIAAAALWAGLAIPTPDLLAPALVLKPARALHQLGIGSLNASWLGA